MRKLEDILTEISNCIDRYQTCKLSFTHDQSEILRDLSTLLFQLSEHRVKFHEDWMQIYFETSGSNPTKEREADYQVPELYKIRHFMTSGYKVLESLRSTISANK